MVQRADKPTVLGRYNNRMEVIEFFKVPVFAVLLDLNIISIEKYCLDYCAKNGGRIKTNAGGYQSNEVEIPQISKEIKKYLNTFSESHALDEELVVGNMWININDFRDYNHTHAHPGALFSGVYYVKTPDNCGNIIFDHPAQDVMNHTYNATNLKEYNQYNSITSWVEAKENLLYVFPGWLKHRVEPNLSNEKRISISFNITQGNL